MVRLQEYHRERRHSGQAGMFHSVEVKANDGGAAINPVLLSPLLNCKTTAGAPSPAKSARAVGKNWEMNSPRASAMPRTPKGLTPMGTPTRSPLCPRSNGTVLFSPVRTAPPHGTMHGRRAIRFSHACAAAPPFPGTVHQWPRPKPRPNP